MWESVCERFEAGTDVLFASAASITLGRFVLPVYEVYKAGEDPFWDDGLDLLGRFGLSLAVVPHFNDNSGGDNYDSKDREMPDPIKSDGLPSPVEPRSDWSNVRAVYDAFDEYSVFGCELNGRVPARPVPSIDTRLPGAGGEDHDRKAGAEFFVVDGGFTAVKCRHT